MEYVQQREALLAKNMARINGIINEDLKKTELKKHNEAVQRVKKLSADSAGWIVTLYDICKCYHTQNHFMMLTSDL